MERHAFTPQLINVWRQRPFQRVALQEKDQGLKVVYNVQTGDYRTHTQRWFRECVQGESQCCAWLCLNKPNERWLKEFVFKKWRKELTKICHGGSEGQTGFWGRKGSQKMSSGGFSKAQVHRCYWRAQVSSFVSFPAPPVFAPPTRSMTRNKNTLRLTSHQMASQCFCLHVIFNHLRRGFISF